LQPEQAFTFQWRMGKWMKRAALGVGAVAALAVIGASVFVATFDANQYKSLAIDWMKAERQRTLVIDGPVDLSVFPRLAVKVSKVRLSERGRAEEFAAIDHAALTLRWLPLLRKQFVVDRIDARGVRALVTRDASGLRNIDDLLGAKEAEPAAGASTGKGGPMRFEVGAVEIDDARLTLRDVPAQLAGTATLDTFRSGRLASGEETPVEFQTTLALEKPQPLRLTFDGKAALTFDATRGSFALRNTTIKVGGDTESLKGLHATVAGALAWDGNALTAGPIDVALSDAKSAAATLGASTLQAQRLVFNPAARRLELDTLRLALSGKQGNDPFDITLDWPQLAVAGEQLKGSGFSGRVKLDGKTALVGRFESGAPSGSFEALRLPGFSVKLDGASGPRKVDGQLKANLLLRPGRNAATLERIELRANLTEPSLQPLALTLGGNAGIDERGVQWALQGGLNNNRFESNGSASFGGSVPAVQATARFDRLDLNQVLATPTSSAASAAAPAAPAETTVGLDGLNAFNGRFALSAGQLKFRQYDVADARLDAALDGGALRVTRLSGSAWGGSIDASGSADAKSKRIGVKLVANGVNANELLKDVAGKDLLEGTGRVSADITTSGTTLGALRSNLAGAAALQLRDGAVKGVNLARVLRQARAALSMKQDAITKASSTEKTDFSELSASARIEGGVARSDDLDLKSPFLRIGGAGKFDIGAGRIDYVARATVAPNATGQDGAELAALRGVTVPVRLSGPFEAIDWNVQWSGVAAAALENKLKDKLSEKLGLGKAADAAPAADSAEPPKRVEDKLKDKLRGWLSK
jgi:AsmA protein